MSKKISFASIMVLVFVVVLMAFAGTALAAYDFTSHTVDHSMVSGSVHDRSAGGNPCEACHTPHGATGPYLWERTLTTSTIGGSTDEDTAAGKADHYSSDIKPLCYSCHDGTISVLGTQTVFSTDHYNHRTTAASYVSSGTLTGPGKDCDRCHNPHDDSYGKYLLPEYKTRTYDENGHVVKYSNDGGTWHMVPYSTVSSDEYNWTSSTVPAGHVTPKTLSRWSAKVAGGDFCASCHESNLPGKTLTSKRNVHPVYQAAGYLVWDNATMGIGDINTTTGLLVAPSTTAVLATTPNPGANPTFTTWLKAGQFDPSNTAAGNPRNGTRLFDSDGTVNLLAIAGSTRIATTYVMCESCHSPHGALADGVTAATPPGTTDVHHLNTMAETALCGNCH